MAKTEKAEENKTKKGSKECSKGCSYSSCAQNQDKPNFFLRTYNGVTEVRVQGNNWRTT